MPLRITTVKTRRVEADSIGLLDLLAESVPAVPEKSVVAITSKVAALCEGSAYDPKEVGRDALIEREAELFLPKRGPYGLYLSIKGGRLMPNAGVDESNAGGLLVPWPKDPQQTAEACWHFIRERYGVSEVGVILTDSTDVPLQWGVVGVCIAHCGFEAINDKVGHTDLFGRKLHMTRVNIADGIAAACVLCMGEADERTPVAIAEDLPFVRFLDRKPSREELDARRIGAEEDLFGELLTAVQWKKGGERA